MTNKTFKMLSLSILVFLVVTSFVSATITFSSQNPAKLPQASGTFNLDVTSDKTEDIDFTATEITDYNGYKITFTPESKSFDDNTTDTITITYIVDPEFDFFGKEYSTTLTAKGNVSDKDVTQKLVFEQTSFCKWNNGEEEDTSNKHIKTQIKGIEVIKGFGEDEEWYPYDEVEVEIRVENRNSKDDIDDIKIEWGIFDKDSGKWVIDVDDEKKFNLKDGDKETKIISFKVDDLDIDFEDLGKNLVFYARATGEDDGSAEDVCSSDSKNINIITKDTFVILDNIEFSETISCGNKLQITADVWNIGDDDQDDVYVKIYNKELGIDQKIEIGDIDAFEDEKLTFEFEIPKDAEEKWYELKLRVYDDDNDIYENDNDDEAEFSVPLKIEGSCSIVPSVLVSPSLESEAKAGQDLIVKITITNTGDKLATYTLNAKDYTEWSTLVNIEPSTIILSAGSSKDVLVTFNVNKDALGDKSFNIEILSEGESIIKQPVLVTIEEKKGFNFPGNIIAGDNWYLWGIGALNVLLIVVIIIVAFRVSRKEE